MAAEASGEEERQARSLALEKAYVHDVYDQIAPHFSDTRYRPWPRVTQFLRDLEPGSVVADVGCGNGKYLEAAGAESWCVGGERCDALASAARSRGLEVVRCDGLRLPFRDDAFDAVLSVAVIHHFATTDRRVAAIRELARLLRIGGKVLITVWAMEQRHRKFDSQDVLVPWHEPVKSSSEDRGSSVERELTTSTTTSDDDVLVYHAYSHISDNEKTTAAGAPAPSQQPQPPQQLSSARRRQKFHHRGRFRSGVARGASSPSSSDLSSPNETCYSFVRRAFQKLSTSPTRSQPYFYRSCRRPCVSESMEFGKRSDPESPRSEFCKQDSLDSEYQDEEDVPIELRHLDEDDPLVLGELPSCASCIPSSPGSKSARSALGDFLNMIPRLLRAKKCGGKEPLGAADLRKRISTASDPREYVLKGEHHPLNGIVRSRSTLSMMSRLEELVSPEPPRTNPNLMAGPRATKSLPEVARRSYSPADALEKLRRDGEQEEKLQNSEQQQPPEEEDKEEEEEKVEETQEGSDAKTESDPEGHLSSYYSMPELYKLTTDPIPSTLPSSTKPAAISFYEQAQKNISPPAAPSRLLVKRSLSVDTAGGATGEAPQAPPRRFSASAASLRGSYNSKMYGQQQQLPRSVSRGSSVKSDTSEESIVSVIPRKGNSITSDTSVDSEESVVSVIQRSTSSGFPPPRWGGSCSSARASPVTVMHLNNTHNTSSSAESSPPQSGKSDAGRFPGSAAVVDQLLQQQQQFYSDHRRGLLRPLSDPPPPTSPPDDGPKPVEEAKPPEPPPQKSPERSPLRTPTPSDTTPTKKAEKDTDKKAEGDLSRTPSPVGPFQYITDPLITGVEARPPVKSLRFNTEVTNLEEEANAKMSKQNGLIESVLKGTVTLRRDALVKQKSAESAPSCSRATLTPRTSKDDTEQECGPRDSDSDMRKSFLKLRERLESLAGGQELFRGFRGEVTPDSRQSSLDESSQVTLSDESSSVMSVEGTSSDNDFKDDMPRPKCDSCSKALDAELHLKKGRCALRKRLRRSCVTIDEVECRESSGDTSPSSSLEWNDFDKAGEGGSGGGAPCTCTTLLNIDPTATHSRGVMQREKSDDRSSKESDSDNLSKGSDHQPPSEQQQRREDLLSSSRDMYRLSFDRSDPDILAAFVETISDITSAWGELYPPPPQQLRQQQQCREEASSDESAAAAGISTFERVLTSAAAPPQKTSLEDLVVKSPRSKPPPPLRSNSEPLSQPAFVRLEEPRKGTRRGSSVEEMSSSQESVPLACHRYYHVFRQGELDALIETHVDNLHILASYQDHANWCVVAEKVQVWTI